MERVKTDWLTAEGNVTSVRLARNSAKQFCDSRCGKQKPPNNLSVAKAISDYYQIFLQLINSFCNSDKSRAFQFRRHWHHVHVQNQIRSARGPMLRLSSSMGVC